MEVEAKREEHMRIVHIRQPSIMDVLSLSVSAHHVGQKIELYDLLDYRWYHPDSKQLWCRLNVGQGLVIRATGVRLTPGLEECLLKVLPERLRPGTDHLPPYLAYTVARTHPNIPIGPQPPLTVMSASVPLVPNPQRTNATPSGPGAVDHARASGERSSASTGSGNAGPAHPHGTDRRAKRKKRGDGTAFRVPPDVIELSSDDDDPPPAKPAPLLLDDVIDISNEDDTPTGSKRPRKRVLRKATEQQRVDLPPANRPRRRAVTIVISDDDASGPSSHPESADTSNLGASSTASSSKQQRVDLPPANNTPCTRPTTIKISDDKASGASSHPQAAVTLAPRASSPMSATSHVANLRRTHPVTIEISDDEASDPLSHPQAAATSSAHASSSTTSSLVGSVASNNDIVGGSGRPVSGSSGSGFSGSHMQGTAVSPPRCIHFGKGKGKLRDSDGDGDGSDGDSDATLV